MKHLALISILALGLAACSDKEPAKPVEAKPAPVAAAPAPAQAPGVPPIKTEAEIKVEQTQVQQTFEQAMAAIPPELREKHQAIYSCTIEQNNKLPPAQQKQIGPDTVREITQRLQANPNLTGC